MIADSGDPTSLGVGCVTCVGVEGPMGCQMETHLATELLTRSWDKAFRCHSPFYASLNLESAKPSFFVFLTGLFGELYTSSRSRVSTCPVFTSALNGRPRFLCWSKGDRDLGTNEPSAAGLGWILRAAIVVSIPD
jgi:hypothetical protein